MITTKIKYSGRKVTLRGFGFGRYQHLALAKVGLASVKLRVRAAIGADDRPMPGLQLPWSEDAVYITKKGKRITYTRKHVGYRAMKAKRGGRPVRDLWGVKTPGLKQGPHMMDNLSIRWASATQSKIAFTTRLARKKGLRNQQRARWLAWSPNDQKVVMAKAQKLFKAEVTQVGFLIQNGGRYKRGSGRTFGRNASKFARR